MGKATASATRPDPARVLSRALRRAGKALGLSQVQIGQAIGRGRTSLSGPIAPESKPGELAALLVRCYRSLYVLVGGDEVAMGHWMTTRNLHTGGVPAEQVLEVQGLVRVTEYLDAVRGKL